MDDVHFDFNRKHPELHTLFEYSDTGSLRNVLVHLYIEDFSWIHNYLGIHNVWTLLGTWNHKLFTDSWLMVFSLQSAILFFCSCYSTSNNALWYLQDLKKKNQFISIIIIFTIMVVCAFGKLMKIAKHHLPLVVFLVLEDTYII